MERKRKRKGKNVSNIIVVFSYRIKASISKVSTVVFSSNFEMLFRLSTNFDILLLLSESSYSANIFCQNASHASKCYLISLNVLFSLQLCLPVSLLIGSQESSAFLSYSEFFCLACLNCLILLLAKVETRFLGTSNSHLCNPFDIIEVISP